MNHCLSGILIVGVVLLTAGCSSPKRHSGPPLAAKIKRFAPTVITADTSRLSAGDRGALTKLIAATRIIDDLYLRQAWRGNEALRQSLATDDSPEGRERVRYFMINMGPWSRLDNNAPFIDGVPLQKPPAANYYPDDMTKEEFTTWVATLPGPEQTLAAGFFTTIRRDVNRHLTVVPYNEEYKDLLPSLASVLREAANAATNPSLMNYLRLRADALLSNDYYASDIAWMDLDSPIDVTIGPYEVYMDDLFNYKAAFEAFIGLRNDEETAKLEQYAHHLQEIEDNLPIAPRYRNPNLGAMAPIRVIDEIAVGGEARAGVQTAAFNLPNDERITAEKGSKRVMLKNVQEAKFRQILVPIAGLALDPAQQSKISFEPFFTHILAHELMHGLGPHSIVVGKRVTTVRQEMKELGSALEEAKADISGLFALQYLIDTGAVPKTLETPMYVTFLASVFRSVRFGTADAHGRGMALQFNYLSDKGAFVYNERTGTFSVDFTRIKDAARELTAEIMTIQAEGSYAKASALLTRHAPIRLPMQRTLDKLAAIPVDIVPEFPLVPPTEK
jgi:hypothetical protein